MLLVSFKKLLDSRLSLKVGNTLLRLSAHVFGGRFRLISKIR